MYEQTHCQICYQGSSCRCFGGPKHKKGEMKSVLYMVGVAISMVLGFLHVITWNSHSISVVVLETKSILGISSSEDHNKMASICFDRKKYSCTEQELVSALKLKSEDTEGWARLGQLQHRMGKHSEAVKSLETYQSQGGKDIDTIYTLARAYIAVNESNKAIDTLTGLLKEKPEVLQVTVTRSYVEALIQANKWTKAKQIIEKTRGTSASYNMFMNGEYRRILSKVGANRKLASH